MDRQVIEAGLTDVLRTAWGEPDLIVDDVAARHDPEAEAGQPWLAVKYGPTGNRSWHGVIPVTVTTRATPSAEPHHRKLAIKVNPLRGVGDTLIPWIIEHEGIDLPHAFGSFAVTAESRDTGGRELQVYELARGLPALEDVLPPYLGQIPDPATGEHALVLGWVELDGLDASGTYLDWPTDRLTPAAQAAARWHAALAGHPERLGWAGARPTTADRVDAAALYDAVLQDAHRRFPGTVTDQVVRRRGQLIDTIASWHAVKDELPATLAHDDFNARNIGFDGDRVVVLDWELARIDSPTRDVVELLAFGLRPGFDPEQFAVIIEAARSALESHGLPIEHSVWREAIRAEIRTEAIDRVGMQCIFATAFQLPYFERIQATTEQMLDLTD